jgi:hypothetical protein
MQIEKKGSIYEFLSLRLSSYSSIVLRIISVKISLPIMELFTFLQNTLYILCIVYYTIIVKQTIQGGILIENKDSRIKKAA